MRDYKIRQHHHSVPGTYRFCAYSESALGKSAVCLGAIRFNEDFSAAELQTWAMPSGNTVREEFEGHYIYRGDSLVAMLRHTREMEPKFYILAIPSAGTESGQRETLTGLLVKIGDGRPVFGTTIHMVRNKHAFEGHQCCTSQSSGCGHSADARKRTMVAQIVPIRVLSKAVPEGS
jgi:hypothetical protein